MIARHACLSLVVLILLFALMPGIPVATAQEATPAACPATTPDEALAVVRRLYEEGVNGGDLSVFEEIVAPDAVYHAATVADASGPEALQSIFGAALEGFPGYQYHLLASAAGSNAVAVRYQAEGVHSGEFRGIEPTGKTVTWIQSAFVHVECGQITEMWSEISQLDRLRQLGVLPTEGPAARMAGVGAPSAATSSTPVATGDTAECAAQSPRDVLAVVDRVRAEVYNDGDLAAMPEIFAADYVHGSANGPDAIGIEAGAQRIGTFVTAFPDMEWTFDEVIVDGDRVTARWTTRGKQDGDLAGFAPTGKPVEFSGISSFTVLCGRVVEFQTEMDAVGMLTQVGAM